MHFVYILKSTSASKTYVGLTDNISRRIEEHNSGASSFTKKYLPWEMIYHEKCDNLQSARKREKYFKSASGRKLLKDIYKWHS